MTKSYVAVALSRSENKNENINKNAGHFKNVLQNAWIVFLELNLTIVESQELYLFRSWFIQ